VTSGIQKKKEKKRKEKGGCQDCDYGENKPREIAVGTGRKNRVAQKVYDNRGRPGIGGGVYVLNGERNVRGKGEKNTRL